MTAGLPGLPEEARTDAQAELERLDAADAFGGVGDPLAEDPFAPVVAPDDELQREIRESTGAPRVLEDLYAEHPDIGGGSQFLRVIRRSPVSWAGMRIAGFLADLHEQPTMEEFASRFGGGDYDVHVMGASRGGALDAAGTARMRSLRVIRIPIPGRPLVTSTQPLGGERAAGAGRQIMGDGSAQVELARIEADRSERLRLEQDRRQLASALANSRAVGPELIEGLDRIAEKRTETVRTSFLEQVAGQRETIKRLEAKCVALEDELLGERRKLLEAERQSSLAAGKAETEAVQRLKSEQQQALERVTEDRTRRIEEMQKEHARRLEEMQKDHAQRMDQLRSEHEKALAVATERTNSERKHAEEQSQRERERLRDDAQRRETQMTNDAVVRENAARQAQEDRLRDLERAHNRELESLKSAHAREVEAIRTSADGRATVATEGAALRTQASEAERTRTQVELDVLRRENADLRKQAHKPVHQAITEARELAAMTGMVAAGDEKAEEGEFDWKKGLFQFLNGAVQKVPEALRTMEEARQANQAAARGGQPVAQQGPDGRYYVQVAQGLPAGQQPPPPQTQQQRRVYRAPAMPGFATPPAWGQPAAGPMEPGANPYAPPAGPPSTATAGTVLPFPSGSQAPARDRAAPPASGREPGATRGFAPFEAAPARTPVAPAQAPEPPTAPEPVAVAAQGGAPAVPDGAAITFEQVSALVDNLEIAVQTGAIPPEQFAQQFVTQVGPDTTRAILSQLNPDQLVDQIAQSRGGSATALATHDGRTYLRQLWAAAAKLVGMGA